MSSAVVTDAPAATAIATAVGEPATTGNAPLLVPDASVASAPAVVAAPAPAPAAAVKPVPANKMKPWLVAPVAGFASALIEIVVIWPAEWCKTQAQLNRLNPQFSPLRHMYSQGFVKVYSSLTPLLIGAPLQGLIRFSSLEYFTELFRKESGEISKFSGLLAGVTAGLVESALVVTPMETTKTRLIHGSQGIIGGVKQVLAQEGIKGFYKGLFPTAAKSASNQALRFVIFNEWKNIITSDRTNKQLSPHESLAGGMVAGLLGALGNTPFDTVKSRMQGLDAKRYNGMFDCAKRMVLDEGVMSLYKGLLFRWARVIPGQGILFLSYDVISQQLTSVLQSRASAPKEPTPKVEAPMEERIKRAEKRRLNRMGSIGSE